MSQKLIVYIDEAWPEQPSAPWVLLDDRDRQLEAGQSEPRHWPASTECEVILSGTQCAWLETRLPNAGRAEQARLLRYALEDQLIRDVDEQHLTVTRRTPGDEGVNTAVLVMSRQRLRQLIAQLEQLGRRPSRVSSEMQAASAQPDGWTVTIGPTATWVLHPGTGPALAFDADSAPALIAHLAASAQAQAHAPASIEIRCTLAPMLPDLAELANLTGQRVLAGPAYAWWSGRNGAADLLHDEFEPRGAGTGWHQRLHAPLALAAGAVALMLVATLGEVLWQRQQLGKLEDRMRRLFETSVPNTPAIAPAVQLSRALGEVRARHGQLRDDDFLALLDAYTEIGGAATRHAVTWLEYANGSLQMQLDGAPPGDPALLQARLGALGFDAGFDGGATLRLSRAALR